MFARTRFAMPARRSAASACFVLAVAALLGGDWAAPPRPHAAEYRPGQIATGARFMVVSEQPLASRVGLDVLRAGGNAVDAAVATALALAVVHPQAGNLGGGGFFLHYRDRDSLCTLVDGRETAPAAARRDMYVDAAGEVDTLRARHGPWSACVPGSLAALQLAWAEYGSQPWRSLVAPAIRLAQDGFVVPPDLAVAIKGNEAKLRRDPTAAGVFLPHGKPLRTGDRLVQKDLARTLRLVAQSGALTLHEGAVADAIVKGMHRDGGPMTGGDLAAYRAIERRPLRGAYRDLALWVPPPPSSGGVTLLQTLGMLAGWQLGTTTRVSSYRTHLVAESLARAFADRNTYLGDPAFVSMPIVGLLAPPYIAERRKSIAVDRATPAGGVQPGDPWRFAPATTHVIPAPATAYDTLRTLPLPGTEGDQTTHLSIVDGDGNIVAFTTTLNAEFGSGWMAPGTGVLLNNHMDDFVSKPGAPNMYGLVGGDANTIAPGKRPLSSMCPTLVLRAGRPWLVLGSRGGPRIISTVLNILIDARDFGAPLESAVAAGRTHHQWVPDAIAYEPAALPEEVARGLGAMGHALRLRATWGAAQCIEIMPDGTRRGVSDPRAGGAALGE
jgi:gamma-glutamyltranspeptidase/glutathione hydrolase